jgi:hypothetical protein
LLKASNPSSAASAPSARNRVGVKAGGGRDGRVTISADIMTTYPQKITFGPMRASADVLISIAAITDLWPKLTNFWPEIGCSIAAKPTKFQNAGGALHPTRHRDPSITGPIAMGRTSCAVTRIASTDRDAPGVKFMSFAKALKLSFAVVRIGKRRPNPDWRFMSIAEGR